MRSLGLRGRAALLSGKLTALLSRRLGRGGGTTLPGDVSRWLDRDILRKLSQQLRQGAIIVTGTNGKTTTAALLTHILERSGKKVVTNHSGANLIFGVTAALLENSSWLGKLEADLAVLEIDEASLPLVASECPMLAIVVTNLFRDQLDRYGELETTAAHVRKTLAAVSPDVKVVLNIDDPTVASLSEDSSRSIRVGIEDARLLVPQLSHAADAKFCPRCGSALEFDGVYFGHVGHYRCPTGDFGRPRPDLSISNVDIRGMETMSLRLVSGEKQASLQIRLSGLYNAYNVGLAVAASQLAGVSLADACSALSNFTPAFGRMERLQVDGRSAYLLLAKNPTGFNEVLRTAIKFGRGRYFLLALNDRIADGQDVSWIWDVDFEQLKETAERIVVTGDRALDLRLRLKYAEIDSKRIEVIDEWGEALSQAARATPAKESLFVVPTYTAMLELRRVLTGKQGVAPYWKRRGLDS